MAHQGKRDFNSASASGASNPHPPKKVKVEEEDEYDMGISSSFIDELNDLEEEEMMRCSNKPASPYSPSSSGTSQHPEAKKYSRPPAPPIDPTNDTITFQQLDIDHYVGSSMLSHLTDPVPVLRMFGVTMEGNSVCAHIHNFRPYFYVPLPHLNFKGEHCNDFKMALNNAVIGDMRSNRDNISTAIEAVEICERCSMYGFYNGNLFPFLKIIVALPKFVAPARRLVCSLSLPPFHTTCAQAFESNIEYEVRYMVDADVVGCNWIECPPGWSVVWELAGCFF